MARHVVLLRGINIGPHNRIAMPALRGALAEAGFDGVRTLIASGNVVLESRARPPAVARRVREVLRSAAIGVDVPVVVRTAAEWREIVASDPFADARDDGRRHSVLLTDEPIDPAHLPVAAAPERLVHRTRELHLWCPGGTSDSPLMDALGRAASGLPEVTTVRNWNTVEKLAAMLDDRA